MSEPLMAQAAALAALCPPTDRGFSVGAVIADARGRIIATGYSREWEGNWHAEEIAIEKARRANADLAGATIYTTLEPCHPRLSGKKSCATHIIESGIRRVVFCLTEPPLYVECTGRAELAKAGIAVEQDETAAPAVRAVNPGRL